MPGNTQELCPGCNTLISVAFKTCPLCKQLQPYKTKVAKKRCNFQNKKAEWKKSIEKNNNRTVVLNSCHVMLDKLAALDFFPILLLGKKLKGKLVADAILGGDYVLDPDLFQRVKLMYEAVLKKTTDPPEATATSPPEATAISPPEATATSPPEATATSPPEAAATNPPEAAATSPPEAAATSPPEAAATSPPEAAATSPPEAAATSPPEAAATSPPEAAATNPPEAAPTSPPEAAAPIPPEAAATSPPEAAATSPPEAAATCPPEAAATCPPEAAPTCPPEAAATNPPEAAPTSPPEAAAPIPPEAAATSPQEATATSPPEATATSPQEATSPPEATATSPPEATGIDITGSSEATRPQAQKAKNRPRNEVHYPVQQMEASKKKWNRGGPHSLGSMQDLSLWQPERIPTNPARRFMRSNWSWQSAGTLSREHHNAAGSILGQEVEK
ncbi:proteoglycan 4-like isoform X2 [Triplophysa dalaica]|uniref:proteoglycan 4-like isoform X2 n=1 Tax=Triplophysa dalaica TaxID=1582913 RepID=UPI0024DF9229|nr:proteoglycan 4-like isoform X2 [Triplophysa dalaica]